MYQQLESVTVKLVEGIRELLHRKGKKGIINQIGPVFHMMFTKEERVENFASFNKRDTAAYALFAERMLEEGVLLRLSGLWYVSTVHGENEVQETLAAVERSLERM